MAIRTLPTPSGDAGVWGQKLNDYLRVSHGVNGGVNVWTTATRPSTPDTDTTGVNTTLDVMEKWNGTAWIAILNISSSSVLDGVYNFEMSIGNANMGSNFLNSSDGGTEIVMLPVGTLTKAIKASVSITEGSCPSSASLIKIQKYTAPATFVDVAVINIPANQGLGSITGTIVAANEILTNGDQLVIDLSQNLFNAGMHIQLGTKNV
jgi:hypothetical protein